MLLKNYFEYNATLFGELVKMVAFNGTEVTMNGPFRNGSKCLVGSGSTPANVNDYKLEEELPNINTTFNVNVSDAGTKVINIISNLTNSTVNISEVGIAGYVNDSTGVLLTRTVLDEPIVLEVGDVVVIETQFA